MDGSMSYATGGRGIFDHVDGPFAGPTSVHAVEVLGSGNVGGFGGLGEEAAAVVPTPALDDAAIEALVGRRVAAKGLSWSTAKSGDSISSWWSRWKTVVLVTGAVGAAAVVVVAVSRARR